MTSVHREISITFKYPTMLNPYIDLSSVEKPRNQKKQEHMRKGEQQGSDIISGQRLENIFVQPAVSVGITDAD
jgi:hypothetical protein